MWCRKFQRKFHDMNLMWGKPIVKAEIVRIILAFTECLLNWTFDIHEVYSSFAKYFIWLNNNTLESASYALWELKILFSRCNVKCKCEMR